MNNPLNTPIKFSLAVAGAALLLCLAFAGFMTWRDHVRSAKIVELQNQIALRDKTIETNKGLYQKLAVQSSDLKDLLDSKDVQLKEAQDALKRSGDQLLTANTVIVQLKQTLAATSKPTVVVTTDPVTKAQSTAISDTQDLGPFELGCAIQFKQQVDMDGIPVLQTLKQIRPIKLSVLVSQTSDGAWRASTTSSEDVFNLDIALAGVNPYVLEEKWYEKVSFVGEAGIGTNPGLLFGAGVDLEIGKFDVGPRVWAVLDHGASPYFGASLAWHPFKKVR